MPIAKEAVNVILHVVLISTFIGIFFFTFGSYIEQKIVKSQMSYIVSSLTNDITAITDPATLASIRTNMLPYLTPPDMSEEDAQAAASNYALMKKAAIVFTVMLVLGFIAAGALSFYYKLPFKEILLDNFIVLCFVALTEASFLYFIAQNYRSADPNYVKYSVVNAMQQFAGTPPAF